MCTGRVSVDMQGSSDDMECMHAYLGHGKLRGWLLVQSDVHCVRLRLGFCLEIGSPVKVPLVSRRMPHQAGV